MYRKYIKRLLDMIVSLIFLPFFLIIFIIIAPIIYLEDKGPIFYNASRLGYKGRTFKMYKFRSMKVNAPDLRNSDGTTWNSEDDPRVTHIGKLLRKTSLDEVPQFINVLKGEMSWIGPRPDLPEAIDLYKGNIIKKIDVKPGLTGYSQAYYRNSSTLEQRFEGDVYYAEHVSLGLDFKILLKTFVTVIFKKNVYRN